MSDNTVCSEEGKYIPRTPKETDIFSVIQESKEPLDHRRITQRLVNRGFAAKATHESIGSLIDTGKLQAVGQNLQMSYKVPDAGDFSDLLDKLK